MEKIYIIKLGTVRPEEINDIAYDYSDKSNGVYIMYPVIDKPTECMLIEEYNDEEELVWSKIYTKKDFKGISNLIRL